MLASAFAVGNPLGLSGSVTSGIISATGRVVTEPGSRVLLSRYWPPRNPDSSSPRRSLAARGT